MLTQNVLTKIWAFMLVSRVEFMVMGIPVIAISALLAASRPKPDMDQSWWLRKEGESGTAWERWLR